MNVSLCTRNSVKHVHPCACRKLTSSYARLCTSQARCCRQSVTSNPIRRCSACASGSDTSANVEGREDTSAEQSQEKFLDVAELLRGNPADFVYEEDSDDEAVWDFESRFVRPVDDGGNGTQHPVAEIKGALDPSQADILSAYSTEQGFKEITVEQLHDNLVGDSSNRSLLLVDVRSPEEYAQGHVPEASSIPLEALSASVRSGKLDKGQQIAIVCRSGSRSAQACVRLLKVFGFEDVVNVKGGTLAWAQAGYSIAS